VVRPPKNLPDRSTQMKRDMDENERSCAGIETCRPDRATFVYGASSAEASLMKEPLPSADARTRAMGARPTPSLAPLAGTISRTIQRDRESRNLHAGVYLGNSHGEVAERLKAAVW
jgi:hypothetical protein